MRLQREIQDLKAKVRETDKEDRSDSTHDYKQEVKIATDVLMTTQEELKQSKQALEQ